MKLFAALLAALCLIAPRAVMAEPWNVGPPTGSAVPALHATDAKGSPVGLADLYGKNGLVLVFFRSAKWCPFCQKQLIELKEATAPLAQRGYRLAAISYDAGEVLAQFTAKWQIAYPLLSDAGSVTIDAWKLRDMRYKPDSYAWGVPYASIYVIGTDGLLKAKLAEEDYKQRPQLAAILDAIDNASKRR
ncbi:MAG: peroxiredoxin family protein [Burkholderiales bacterium]|uniref:peroxiredoxin family protein n=1 Tax=Roseateles sp. TaxID=1971397 RepID=UPI000FAA16A8|nr:MAG: peroxiredoxin family protein [Burkholderiales bacterium]